MVSTCFYFQVHQPYRLRKYSIFDIGNREDYFDDNSETNLNNEQPQLSLDEYHSVQLSYS